jgi:hypothetical protein
MNEIMLLGMALFNKFQYMVRSVIIIEEGEAINFNLWHLRVFVFSDWTEMQCCKN